MFHVVMSTTHTIFNVNDLFATGDIIECTSDYDVQDVIAEEIESYPELGNKIDFGFKFSNMAVGEIVTFGYIAIKRIA